MLIPHSSSQKQPSLSSSSASTIACLIPSEPLLLLARIWFQLEGGEQGVLYSARAYSSGKKKGRLHVHESENHSDLSLCAPVINTLGTRKHLIDFSHPIVKAPSFTRARSEPNALLWPCLSGCIIAEATQDVHRLAEHVLQGDFSG